MENEIIVSVDSLSPNNKSIKSGIYATKHLNAKLSLLDFQFRTIAINQGTTKKRVTNLVAFPKRNKSISGRLISNDSTNHLILKSQIPLLGKLN